MWRVAYILVVVFSIGFPAHAGPSVEDTAKFLEHEWERLCADPGLSRVTQLTETSGARACSATIDAGTILLEARSAPSLDRAVDGALMATARWYGVRQRAEITPHARFFCSRPDRSGYMTLYMNCRGSSSVSSYQCVEVRRGLDRSREEMGREDDFGQSYRQSFADLIRVREADCHVLRRAFRHLAQRSKPRRRGGLANFTDYFSE